MLEATTKPNMAGTETMLMPMNFPDSWWLFSTAIIVGLLALAVYFLKRMVDKQDQMCDSLHRAQIQHESTKTTLMMHIADIGMHCKGAECIAFRRRDTDHRQTDG